MYTHVNSHKELSSGLMQWATQQLFPSRPRGSRPASPLKARQHLCTVYRPPRVCSMQYVTVLHIYVLAAVTPSPKETHTEIQSQQTRKRMQTPGTKPKSNRMRTETNLPLARVCMQPLRTWRCCGHGGAHAETMRKVLRNNAQPHQSSSAKSAT